MFDGVHGQIFRRRLSKTGEPESWLRVERNGNELIAYLPLGGEPIYQLLRRLGRLFDLHTDGATLHEHLSADRFLAPWVKAAPGLRVPGAWDGFETCVRAILGQQVSVTRGTELANARLEMRRRKRLLKQHERKPRQTSPQSAQLLVLKQLLSIPIQKLLQMHPVV